MNNSFNTYLESVRYDKHETDILQVKERMKLFEGVPRAISAGLHPSTVYSLNYRQRAYSFFANPANNLMGHCLDTFLEGGVDFMLTVFHKDDFGIFNDRIFPRIVEFLRSVPADTHSQYLFTLAHRAYAADGGERYIMQKQKFITDSETNLPMASVGSILDITTHGNEHAFMLRIDKEVATPGGTYLENTCSEMFYCCPAEALFTKREREVIGWLAEGLTGKEIADKLFISENTVANHRKNILRKSNTKNVAQLIGYALRNRII